MTTTLITKLLILLLSLSTLLFSGIEDMLKNLTPLSFDISYSNFLNLYKGKNLNNLYGNTEPYSKYLRAAFQGLPYTRAFYISEENDTEPINKSFLFYNDRLFLQSMQFITVPDDYMDMISRLKAKYGQPTKQTSEENKTMSTLWEFDDKSILISYTSQSFSKDENDSVLNLLVAAFYSIEGSYTTKPNEIFESLKKAEFLNAQGILIKDLSSNTILSFLNLSPLEEEIVKVTLLSTKYGEANLLYIDKKRLKEAMDARNGNK
ncbi:MAG: hypothetical protein A2Y40_08095 [Candidatus Margulisbacteria bacterium GWF2_35_9]|nr:MAG: hypothetical protein A2Y40_08095 [Candidatus Margulisbacteria bacterium GWF2_35_9]